VEESICILDTRRKQNEYAAINTAGNHSVLDMSRERNRQIVPRKGGRLDNNFHGYLAHAGYLIVVRACTRVLILE